MSLTRRYRGTPSRADFTSPNLKLTQTEETVLIQQILSIDIYRISPTQVLVKEIAELLLAEHIQVVSAVQPKIGQYWVYCFINQYSELKSQYNRKYNYQRAKYEDPEIIQAWFLLVQNTIAKYRIADKDIYNFDKTGFQIGVIATAKVVTAAKKACTDSIQPGNWEQISVIESVNSTRQILLFLIIFKGQLYQLSWYKYLPSNWIVGVSKNG